MVFQLSRGTLDAELPLGCVFAIDLKVAMYRLTYDYMQANVANFM